MKLLSITRYCSSNCFLFYFYSLYKFNVNSSIVDYKYFRFITACRYRLCFESISGFNFLYLKTKVMWWSLLQSESGCCEVEKFMLLIGYINFCCITICRCRLCREIMSGFSFISLKTRGMLYVVVPPSIRNEGTLKERYC